MPDYKIIKYCRMCKERFVVGKGESRRYICDKCEEKYKDDDDDEEELSEAA